MAGPKGPGFVLYLGQNDWARAFMGASRDSPEMGKWVESGSK